MERAEALSYYDLFPFHHHPLWTSIIEGKFSREQVLKAEIQHYLRSEIGKTYREQAAIASRHIDESLYDLLSQTAQEESYDETSGLSHAGLIRKFLIENGVTSDDILNSIPTPGNIAAISIYKDIAARGPLHHMIGAGCVEHFYSKLCLRIRDAYTDIYQFAAGSFETYEIHGPMDQIHGERALQILELPLAKAMSKDLGIAIRDAFVATSLHYDGMYQAATGTFSYWSGR